MATPNEKLATALEALHRAQGSAGIKVFKSDAFSRTERERLVANGFLTEAIKGWLYLTRPDGRKGDTTPWIASFWEFCAAYANDRFGADWHVSPEQSLLLATADTVVPQQLILHSPKGSNNITDLPFKSSIFDLKTKGTDPDNVEEVDGIRRLKLPAALTQVREAFFHQQPLAAQIALAQIRSASQLLDPLLASGATAVAGRLAGALRHVDKGRIADEIISTMARASYQSRETNPFKEGSAPIVLRDANPVVGRLSALWQSCRESVIGAFPEPPGIPGDVDAYLAQVDEVYENDAYHSLSIEGYTVTPELIERVRSGSWDPKENDEDKNSRDALAARGYWESFQLVKKSVEQILNGADPAVVVERDHNDWYRALFAPSVVAGLTKARDLAGYRNHPVYLKGSEYVPPRAEAVMDGMTTLFELIREEKEASVRAVLGHWLFGYVHPYPDGNGRTGRFLLNALLASGGYPWTIVRVDDRTDYLNALDDASIRGNAEPFARLIAARVRAAMDERPTPPAPSPI